MFKEFVERVIFVGENQDGGLAAFLEKSIDQLDPDKSFAGACQIKIETLIVITFNQNENFNNI
jgi:hypothetical protein